MKRHALWITPLALLLALGFWLSNLPEPAVTEPAVTAEKTAPRYAMSGVRWLRLDNQGRPQFRAQAATIDFYDDDSARLHTLGLDALGGFDSVWHLTAPSGYVPARQKRLRLDGPVTGEGQLAENETAHLHAGQLWVDQTKREISSDRPVLIESPRRQAQAQGLRADFGGKRIELRGKVEAHYDPRG